MLEISEPLIASMTDVNLVLFGLLSHVIRRNPVCCRSTPGIRVVVFDSPPPWVWEILAASGNVLLIISHAVSTVEESDPVCTDTLLNHCTLTL